VVPWVEKPPPGALLTQPAEPRPQGRSGHGGGGHESGFRDSEA
jgi:hypothetical protein